MTFCSSVASLVYIFQLLWLLWISTFRIADVSQLMPVFSHGGPHPKRAWFSWFSKFVLCISPCIQHCIIKGKTIVTYGLSEQVTHSLLTSLLSQSWMLVFNLCNSAICGVSRTFYSTTLERHGVFTKASLDVCGEKFIFCNFGVWSSCNDLGAVIKFVSALYFILACKQSRGWYMITQIDRFPHGSENRHLIYVDLVIVAQNSN